MARHALIKSAAAVHLVDGVENGVLLCSSLHEQGLGGLREARSKVTE